MKVKGRLKNFSSQIFPETEETRKLNTVGDSELGPLGIMPICYFSGWVALFWNVLIHFKTHSNIWG